MKLFSSATVVIPVLLIFKLNSAVAFNIADQSSNSFELLSDLRTRNEFSFKNDIFNETDLAKLIVKSLVPFYVEQSLRSENNKESRLFQKIKTETFQSPVNECGQHLQMLLSQVLQIIETPTIIVNASTWALQMIDAWGKVPEGILSGHVNSYGDWDECVNIDVTIPANKSNFQGKYCWAYVIPTALLEPTNTDKVSTKESVSIPELIENMINPIASYVLPSVSVCVPSSCSQDEVQAVMLQLFESVPSISPIVSFCNTNEYPPFNTGTYSMIAVLSVLTVLIIFGSITDVVLDYNKKFKEIRNRTSVQIFLAFSIVTNIRKWQNTDSSEGGFGCIHGLRFLSTCWVLLCHTLVMFSVQLPSWNTIDLNNIYENHWTMYFLLNGYFSVDTFFTMSGLLACYSILKGLQKIGGNLNFFSLIAFHLKMYLHRYLRLTPTYALIIGIIATLYPYFGDGPFFNTYAESTSKLCRDNWWHNLLYINNIVPYNGTGEAMCEGESWYITNDMQFFILAPIFVTLIWKWKIIGMAVLGSACVASILAPAIVVGTEKIAPTYIFWKKNFTVIEVYIRPWHRIGPYLVGMWMGYVLFKIGRKPVKLSKLAVVGGWMLSTATALSLILGVIPYYYPDNDDNAVGAGFYAGLSRFTWGIVICWIIFACSKGYGGWINSFLSWKVFIPLGRLTFCVYLSSFSVQTLLHATIRQPVQFDMYRMTNIFFSHLIMCFLVGFLLTMTLESPFIALEKIMFGTATVRDPKLLKI